MAIFVSANAESPSLTTVQFYTNSPAKTAGVGGSAASSGFPSEKLFNEKPPLTNRGALITVPLVNQFLIDWAAFTFKINDPHEVIKIIGLKPAMFNELERGIH